MRRHRRAGLAANALLLVLAVAAGALAYWQIRGDDSTANAAARTTTVSRGTVLTTVSASGSLEPRSTSTASFASSGTVKSINVEVGQHVKKGQVLAKLNAAADRRALQSAWLTRRYDQENLAQMLTTTASDDISLIQARATLASSTASYYTAVETLAGTILRAPSSGTVTAINGTVGGSSSGGSSATSSNAASSTTGATSSTTSSSTSSDSSSSSGFVTIEDLDHLDARAFFAEADAANLKVGQTATITFDALPGVSAEARISSIDSTSTVSSNVVEYGVTFRLLNPPTKLRSGQSVSISVVTGRANNALTVPSTAITGSGNAATLTVVRNGQQTTVAVRTGLEGDSTTQVLSGVTEGEQVVLPTASTTTGGFGSAGFRFGGAGGGLGGLPTGGGRGAGG
jgi:macrolide-specific efflux system membrane fusion protein